MTNNANNDFERKVRSSLEGYEASFDPADWSDMDKKLQTLPRNTTGFKWTFSMNVIVAIIACASIVFFVLKMNSNTRNSAEPNAISQPVKEIKQVIGPVTQRETVHQTPVTTTPFTVMPVDSNQTALITDDNATGKASDTENSGTEKNAEPNRNRRMNKDVISVDAIKPTLIGDENQHLFIYPDMIDPAKGIIKNTKERTGTEPAQTEVNVGWHDIVMYPPNGGNSTDSVNKSGTSSDKSEVSDKKAKSNRKSLFSRKPKGEKRAGKTEPVVSDTPVIATPAPENKVVDTPTEPTKNDSLKKTKLKNPKYKEGHSMLDPN